MAKKKPSKPRTKSKLKSTARGTKSTKAAKKRTVRAADKKKWYAYCDVRKPPHARDPATLQYLPWAGPMRDKYSEARKDAKDHNKHPGHSAMVL